MALMSGKVADHGKISPKKTANAVPLHVLERIRLNGEGFAEIGRERYLQLEKMFSFVGFDLESSAPWVEIISCSFQGVRCELACNSVSKKFYYREFPEPKIPF